MNAEYRELSAALKRDAYGPIHSSYEYFFAIGKEIQKLSSKADAKLAEIHQKRQNK